MSSEISKETIKSKCRQLLAASALVPVLCALAQPPNFKPLIYAVFVVNYLIHSRENESDKTVVTENTLNTQTLSNVNKFVEALEFLALFAGAGLAVQLFDLLAYFCSNREVQWIPWLNFSQSQIAQTDYFYQLTMSLAYLGTMALVWLLALTIFKFSYRQAVLTAAAFGALAVLGFVLVPQSYSVSSWLDIVSASLASSLYWASIVGIALTTTRTPLRGKLGPLVQSRPARLVKYAVTIALLVVAMVIWKILA